ncbi:MAG: flavin reductase [Acidobacteria bacterium]|nr:MAG: flavin reductase [Acidobacteriota bacterium]
MLDQQQFRQLMGRFATGVTVVTLAGENGAPYGLTVNAFTSVSLDPMLVLICIDKKVGGYELFKPGRGFAVNILAEDQEEISNRFATRDADRFARLTYRTGVTGAPILDGVLAYLECRITRAYDGGDHTIFLGEVKAGQIEEHKSPLLFFGGRYGHLATTER